MTQIELLAKTIVDFYATPSAQLARALEDFRQNRDAWRMAIALMDASMPMNVQFYGADVLQFTIAKNFETISERLENITLLKNFLLQKLSTSAHSLPHSVLNKLTSGLALFLLKSMPDIWTDPLKELMLLWTNQLELLLTIFAEIPNEFQRLNMSLDHRKRVRGELQNAIREVVQIVKNVLDDPNSSGSLRNAALECVESWLKLPYASLLDFMPVFDAVFANIGNDFMALARIVGTLKANDELRTMPRLVWQVTHVIAASICPLIQTELATIFGEEEGRTDRMTDLVPLLCTIVEFLREFAKIIVDNVCRNMDDQSIVGIYSNLCQFFLQISNLPGLYPLHECLSDLAEPWWISLREELLQPDEGSTWSEAKQRLKEEAMGWYLQMLATAIAKFAHSPAEVEMVLDRESMERFKAYRLERSDVSLNAIQIAPFDTMTLLSKNLHSALDAYNPERAEAVIHLITEAADFVKESQVNYLIPAILKCGTIEEWSAANVPPHRMIKFAQTFLHFVKATEHHLMSSQRAAEQAVPSVVRIVLSYLQLPELTKGAFESLIVIMKSREPAVKPSIDQIIQGSYTHFTNANHPEEVRLLAMRCVGMGLSFKGPETIIESLNQILLPVLVELENAAESAAAQDDEQQMARINFQLSVLAQLVATLEVKQPTDREQSTSKGGGQAGFVSPVKTILDKALPLFNKLFLSQRPTNELISRVCDVLKAGIQSLYTDISPLLENYLNFLDVIIETNPGVACELAKKIFLTFHKQSAVETSILVRHLARWFSARFSASSRNQFADFPNEQDEKLVELAYHIVKKFWDCLMFATSLSGTEAMNVGNFIENLCFLIGAIIERSRDTTLLQESFRTLNLLMKNFAQTDNHICAKSVESGAERIIAAVFLSIRSEATMSSSLNLIADILHLYATKYPAETREIIQRLPGADSQLVGAMFSVHSTKNFRLRVMQIHQAALTQRQSAT